MGYPTDHQQYFLYLEEYNDNFLQIPPYQLPHVTQQAQSHHTEQVRLYNECYNVKQALCKQIITAVQDTYIAALKNRQTNKITKPLDQIIEYLFHNFGRVTPSQLVHKEQQLTNWTYDPTLPIVVTNKSTFHTVNIIQEVVEGVQQALAPTPDDVAETEDLIHQANAATSQAT